MITDFHILLNTDVDSHSNFILHPNEIFRPGILTNESFVSYKDEHLLLGRFNEQMRQKLINERMQSVSPDAFVEDTCSYKITKSLVFQPHELRLEGLECYRLDMTISWKSRIIRPPIVSKFDIKTRGRVDQL